MRLKTIVSLSGLVLGLFVILQSAAAQDGPPESSPLSVTAQISSDLVSQCNGAQGLVVQFSYEGAQPLRGYLVILTFVDSVTGQKFARHPIQEIRDLREPMIASGAEWTRTICFYRKTDDGSSVSFVPKTPAGNPEAVSASVDVLAFADGSNWGPKTSPQSNQLLGTLDGMDFSVKSTDLERYISPLPPERAPVGIEDVQSQKIGPLTFKSGVWRDDKGQDMLAVDATNDGDKPIRGYVFTEAFFDPSTRDRIRRVTTKQLEIHGNPADYLAPGASWVAGPRKFSHLADGTLATYTITLDFVVFADGSTFGPKNSRESDEVLGMFHGIDTANLLSRGASANQEQ
jgi:hypothetical protein